MKSDGLTMAGFRKQSRAANNLIIENNLRQVSFLRDVKSSQLKKIVASLSPEALAAFLRANN